MREYTVQVVDENGHILREVASCGTNVAEAFHFSGERPPLNGCLRIK